MNLRVPNLLLWRLLALGAGGWRLSGGEESLGGGIGFAQSPGCNVGQEKWYILCQRHPSGVPWTTCPRRHGKSPTTQSRRLLAVNPNFGLSHAMHM